MARKLFDPVIYSVLTSGGAIGVGWTLGFYAAGTTTEIVTYNAASGGSANANPVESDAGGRFGEVWIDAPDTIKWVLSDENGVVKATVDDVPIADDPPEVDASLEDFLAGDDPLPVANGGTGAESAATALSNLGALPAIGGTVTGDITRSGKGDYLYFSTAALTNAEFFLTASGDSDPRGGLPGQFWAKY